MECPNPKQYNPLERPSTLVILGVSETHWTDNGRRKTNGGTVILHSGHGDKHIHGVAVMIPKEKVNTLVEWKPINERLLRARFNSKYSNLTIIQCYTPTNDVEKEIKEEWYEQLQTTISKVP